MLCDAEPGGSADFMSPFPAGSFLGCANTEDIGRWDDIRGGSDGGLFLPVYSLFLLTYLSRSSSLWLWQMVLVSVL